MKVFEAKFFRPTALAVTIAMGLPSASMAWEGDAQPDEVVTMTVDLPATDGSDGDGGVCSGYSSIETSVSSLQATLDEVDPGDPNPTLEERLAFFDYYSDDTFTDPEDQETYDIFLAVEDGDDFYYEINPTWSASIDRGIAEALDTNGNGRLDAEDNSPLMLDRRVFVSSPFTVTFDASTCIDSTRVGVVWTERTEVETLLQEPGDGDFYWDSAEFDIEEYDDPYEFLMENPRINASAYLLRPTRLIDGLINVPLQFANYEGWGPPLPVVAGDEGSAEIRGVLQMYGDETEGQYRVKYGFWLELNSSDFFFDEFPYWFFWGP